MKATIPENAPRSREAAEADMAAIEEWAAVTQAVEADMADEEWGDLV